MELTRSHSAPDGRGLAAITAVAVAVAVAAVAAAAEGIG